MFQSRKLSEQTKHLYCTLEMESRIALFSHLNFGHLILFRISDFVLRIYSEKRSIYPYWVLPQSPVLWAGILCFQSSIFFTCSSASTRRSTSSLVLYRAKEALMVPGISYRFITGWAQ